MPPVQLSASIGDAKQPRATAMQPHARPDRALFSPAALYSMHAASPVMHAHQACMPCCCPRAASRSGPPSPRMKVRSLSNLMSLPPILPTTTSALNSFSKDRPPVLGAGASLVTSLISLFPWKLCSVSLLWCAIVLGALILTFELLVLSLDRPVPFLPPSHPSLIPPQLRATSPVNGSYHVPMGYWKAEVAYSFPEVDAASLARYTRLRGVPFLPWWLMPFRKDCFELARTVKEPYSPAYHPRRGQPGPGPFPGGAPRALYRWDAGRITREQFDATPHWLRGPECLHCVDTIRFKVLKGQLFMKGERHKEAAEPWHLDVAIEQLLVMLHLFPDLPPVDFIVHFGDGCTDKHPVLNWNICSAAFTYPTYSAWQMSLGIAQTHELHKCYMARYPFDRRESKVYWRGSTTNQFFSEDQDGYRTALNRTNMFQVPRVQLHLTSIQHQPDLDWKLFRIIGAEDHEKKHIKKNLPGMARKQKFEDFNDNAIVLDLDGNGWSDRFVQLMRFNTPILKQASNMSAFFEHLAAPTSVVEYFNYDLSDVVERAKLVLAEYRLNPARLISMAQHMQGLGSAMLTHIGLSEALAYTLQEYARMIDWEVTSDPTYRLVSPTLCCKYTVLPKEVLEHMHGAHGH